MNRILDRIMIVSIILSGVLLWRFSYLCRDYGWQAWWPY
jgi:hypothetical protein